MADDQHVHALHFAAQYAVPTHLNLRKETHGDEQVSAVDITITANVDAEVLDQLAPGSSQYWEGALWDEDGEVRALGLAGAVPFARKATGQHARLSVPTIMPGTNEITLPDATVRKFKARPMAGRRVELGFQIQAELDYPDRVIPWLNERYLAGVVDVEFQGSTQMDIEDVPEAPAPAGSNGADGEGHQSFPDALDGTRRSALGGA